MEYQIDSVGEAFQLLGLFIVDAVAVSESTLKSRCKFILFLALTKVTRRVFLVVYNGEIDDSRYLAPLIVSSSQNHQKNLL